MNSEIASNEGRFIFPVNKKCGFFSSKSYALILTQGQIIFVNLSDKMIKEATAEAFKKAKDEGKGYFAQVESAMMALNGLCSKYYSHAISEILAENNENFSISNDEIKRLRFISFNAVVNDETLNQNVKSELIIETNKEKIKLTLANSDNDKLVSQNLKQIFGDKLK